MSEKQKQKIFREMTGRPNQLEWLNEIRFFAQAILWPSRLVSGAT